MKDRKATYLDLLWLIPFVCLKFAITVTGGIIMTFLAPPIMLITLLVGGDFDKVSNRIKDWLMGGGFGK